MEKPNIRFKDGEWLDAERLNKAMEAVDTAADTANAAEASAASANQQAQASAQSAANAAASANRVDQAVAQLPDGQAVVLKTAQLDRAVSPYGKKVSISLPVASAHQNKMLTTSESGAVVEVTQQGWGITTITNEEMQTLGITFGDVMNLVMKSGAENLMVTGAVPFAYEVQKKDAEGNVIYSRLYSMFRASNSDIAEWGGIVKEVAIEDGANLVISHPLSITTMEVTRDGIHATIAAMWRNVTEILNAKTDWNGRYPGMTVGAATEVEVQTVTDEYGHVINESQELLTPGRCLISAPDASSRDAASTLDGDTSVSFKSMRGVTVGGNQMVPANGGSVALEANRKYMQIVGSTYTLLNISAKETRTFAKGTLLYCINTLFPADAAFVNTITSADKASSICHRLGFFSFSQKIG